jgi:hypothetical protein
MAPLAEQATNRKKFTTKGMTGHNGVHHVLHTRPRISGPYVHNLRDAQELTNQVLGNLPSHATVHDAWAAACRRRK